MPRVFHYHPSIVPQDAIGYSLTFLHRAMLQVGIASFLVCDRGSVVNAPPLTLTVEEFAALRPSSTDLLIFHHSFLDSNADRLLALSCRNVMVYHNITPGHFFRSVGQGWLADSCDQARESLSQMSGSFQAVVGDSAYNAKELAERRYPKPRVIPVFYNNRLFGGRPGDNEAFLQRRLSGEVNLVFIGRYVPNKRLDNLIRITSVLKKLLRLPVRLRLHGKVWDRGYFLTLRRLTEELDVEQNVNFEIGQPEVALRTSLASADAFVSASEHEGFMVPLVEAFSAGCPVVALESTAVTETCGPAGCLLATPDLEMFAGSIAALRQNRDLRVELIRAQSKRADSFSQQRTLLKWDALLRDFLPTSLVTHAHRV
jgi:glycosyltransferase involved in cell wall biosynthesis